MTPEELSKIEQALPEVEKVMEKLFEGKEDFKQFARSAVTSEVRRSILYWYGQTTKNFKDGNG